MAYFKDLDTETQIAAGPNIRAVGWLSQDHEFRTGAVAPSLKERLDAFVAAERDCVRALAWGAFGGSHTCEFCKSASGAVYVAVPHQNLLFVSPSLIAHYVDKHQYLPPSDFLSALDAAPLPGSLEYNVQVAPFNSRLKGKHFRVQCLVAQLAAELGWDRFLYFSPPASSDPNVIVLGDHQRHTPQSRIIVRVDADSEVLSLEVGSGSFRDLDSTTVGERFTHVTISTLIARITDTFVPAKD